MKWFFRIIALTLVLFIGLCLVGRFSPAIQRVESSVMLPVDAEAAYVLISDLRGYPEWTGIGGPNSVWVYGGADEGVGQTAAWQAGDRIGYLEILQAQPGAFVRVSVKGPLGEQTVTLALSEQGELTTFLVQAERHLGGFPYLGRLAGLRQNNATQTAVDRAAEGFRALFR